MNQNQNKDNMFGVEDVELNSPMIVRIMEVLSTVVSSEKLFEEVK